jgi:hypothetical protein
MEMGLAYVDKKQSGTRFVQSAIFQQRKLLGFLFEGFQIGPVPEFVGQRVCKTIELSAKGEGL